MAFVAGRRSFGTGRVPIASGHLGAQEAPRGTPGVEVVNLNLIQDPFRSAGKSSFH
jgi:hypothetical protein